MTLRPRRAAQALGRLLAGAAFLLPSSATHAADAVKLTVGYQPYDTISYSAAVT